MAESKAKIVWKKIPRFIRIIIIILVALLITALILKIVAIVKKPPNANYITGGGEVRNNFNPAKYADAMYNVTGGIFTLANTKLEAAATLQDLSDNELIDVYNYWNKEYSTKTSWGEPFGSLTNTMKKETNVPFIVVGGGNAWQELINRLDHLNLK